jgi:hypothetical protein
MSWIDYVTIVVALAVPLVLILRFGKKGILLGGIVSWLFGVVVDAVTTNVDPEAGPIKELWLRYGWAVTLVYASFLYLLKWGYSLVRSPDATPPEGK